MYGHVRSNDNLKQLAAQCINQMATLSGEIFSDESSQRAYLEHFLLRLLQLLNVDSIIRDIPTLVDSVSMTLQYFPSSLFASISPGLCANFVRQLTQLTCNICVILAQHEVSSSCIN